MHVDGREVTVSGNLLQPLTRRTNDMLRVASSGALLASVITSSLVTRTRWDELEKSVSRIVGVLTPQASGDTDVEGLQALNRNNLVIAPLNTVMRRFEDNNSWLKDEIEPAFARDGTLYDHDDGVRPDSSVESLAKLTPAFERPWGKVTPGNSSQITDGASWVILASEDAVREHKLQPKAVIVDSEWSALDPSIMGLGPVLCSTAILKRHQLALGDIDLWELNEAFAAQVLGCLAAWEDHQFCRSALGLDGAAGSIPRDRLNVDGGAIGVGHPVGASGNRIVLHLVNAMKRLGVKRGIATECIGGGQGGAMLIETV